MGGNSPVGNGGPRDPQEVRQCQVQGPAQGSERSQNRLGGDGSGAHAEAAVPSLELLFAVTSTPSWGKQRSDTGMSHLLASPAGCWWQECSPATDLQQHGSLSASEVRGKEGRGLFLLQDDHLVTLV